MASLSFPNFAALRPSPNVAVQRPQEDNTLAFIMSEAISSIREEAKAKRDVDALTLETNALATYMEKRSPELAAMLRKKTESYVPDAFNGYRGVDVNQERQGLLRGTLDLYKNEISERRSDLSSSTVGLQDNWKTELVSAEKLAAMSNGNYMDFEQAEDRRQMAHKESRYKYSHESIYSAPYKRQANPYAADKQQSEDRLKSLLNKTPEEILNKATPKKVSVSGTGVVPGTDSDIVLDLPRNTGGIPLTESSEGNPLLPTIPPPIDSEAPVTPEEPLVPPPVAPAPGTYDDVAPTPPDLEVGDKLPDAPATTNVVPSPPEMRSAIPDDPEEMDIKRNIELSKQRDEAARKQGRGIVDLSMKRIELNSEDYEGKSQAVLNEEREKAIKEIDAVPNPQSRLGQDQIATIASNFQSLANSTRTKTERSVGFNVNNLEPLSDFYWAEDGVATKIGGVKQPVRVERDRSNGKLYIKSKDNTYKLAQALLESGEIIGPASLPPGEMPANQEPIILLKDLIGPATNRK